MVLSDEGITGVPGAEDKTVFPDKNITGVSNAESEEASIKRNLDGKYGTRLTPYSLRDWWPPRYDLTSLVQAVNIAPWFDVASAYGLYKVLNTLDHTMLIQYGMIKGMEIFFERG